MDDASQRVLDDPLALEVKRLAQPVERARYIAIAQAGDQRGRGVLAQA